jgi:uncharacterized membrane protein
MTLEKLIQASIFAALATAATQIAAASNGATPDMEKCYGIAKAGKNDCQTKGTSCAGTASKDREPDAFLVLPKGICEKIAGGSLTSG